MKYIDIHGHLNFPEYDADREEVIKRAQDAGVAMISVGTDIASSERAVKLAETHENMWATVGIHPTDTMGELNAEDMQKLRELAAHPKVVAIGECGLDYFHGKPEDISRQRQIFAEHIQIANKINKPLMLHVRNGKDAAINAYQEVIEILKSTAKVRANFHFFAGTLQDAQDIVAMGNTMSFTGAITFGNNYTEIVRDIPAENILSETDCPFVAPIPYRGKRNEPVYVIETVKKIAEIRATGVEKVAEQLIQNAQTVFGIRF